MSVSDWMKFFGPSPSTPQSPWPPSPVPDPRDDWDAVMNAVKMQYDMNAAVNPTPRPIRHAVTGIVQRVADRMGHAILDGLPPNVALQIRSIELVMERDVATDRNVAILQVSWWNGLKQPLTFRVTGDFPSEDVFGRILLEAE